jgi:YVTN family beta-propeller protein
LNKLSLLVSLALVACSGEEGRNPQDAAGTSGRPAYLVYATNERSGDISIIDPDRRAEIGRIPIGKRPRGLVASPDGRILYVALSGSPIGGPGVDESTLPPADKAADGIAVIDIASRKVLRTLRGISDPEQMAITRDGRRLYVASEDTGRLIVIGTDGDTVATLPVGDEPEGVAISPDGSVVLATSEADHSIAIVRGGDNPRVTGRVVVGERPRNAGFLGNDRALVPGEFDASLTLVDYAQLKALRTITLPEAERPMGIAVATDGFAYVTTGRGGKLYRIDPRDGASDKPVVASVTVGERPWGLALAPDGRRAFTANGPGNDVSVIDLPAMRVVGRVPTRGGPWGVIAVPTAH